MHDQPAARDLRLQLADARATRLRLRLVDAQATRALRGRRAGQQRVDVLRPTEVEARELVAAPQRRVHDLELGDAAVLVRGVEQPVVADLRRLHETAVHPVAVGGQVGGRRAQVGRVRRPVRAVPLAEQADEERRAPVDVVEAELDDAAGVCLRVADAPAQVDRRAVGAARLAEGVEAREDALHQDVALNLQHVTP